MRNEEPNATDQHKPCRVSQRLQRAVETDTPKEKPLIDSTTIACSKTSIRPAHAPTCRVRERYDRWSCSSFPALGGGASSLHQLFHAKSYSS